MALSKTEQGAILDDQVEEALDELEFQMSQGHTQSYLDLLAFYARMHRYSWGNMLLIKMQRPDAQLCAGMRTWNQLGFTIRKGEHGIMIRAPWMRKVIDQETGETTEQLVAYLPVFVYDIGQTNEYPDRPMPTMHPDIPGDWHELYDYLKLQVLCNGVIVTHDAMPFGVQGIYWESHICINEGLADYWRIGVLVHEWAHHLAHATADQRQGTARKERELIAESVSFTVCHSLGVRLDSSRDYLLSYQLTDEDVRRVVKEVEQLTKLTFSLLRLEPNMALAKAA